MNTSIKNNATILFIYALAFALLFGFWTFLNKPEILPEPLSKGLKLQSVSYAPFKYDESPDQLTSGLKIPSERLDKDLALLAQNFESIRIYSVNGLEEIPFYARKYGLKVMLGIWIGAEDERNEKEIKTAIKLAKEYSDVISCVIVGNEVLLRRELSSTKLASYIIRVKEALPNTAVTYADVWEFWLKNPELSSLVDFVTIHILPYWEDIPVSVNEALIHVGQTRGEVAGILEGKDILIGETGWPSEGKMRGASTATPYAQAEYLRGFLALALQNNWKYNLIEAFDQPWKRVSEGAVGGYWGIYDKDSQDKNVLFGAVSDFQNKDLLFALSATLLLLAFVLQIKHQVKSLKLPLYTLAASILLTLQYNQYQIAPKDIVDMLRITLLFGASLMLYFQIARLLLNASLHENIAKFSLYILVFLFLVESIYLTFDGRYRGFEFYAAAFTLLSFSLMAHYSSKNLLEDPFVKFASVSIFGLAFGLIFVEGFQNTQAIAYALISLAFGALLYTYSKTQTIGFTYKYLLFTLLIAAGVLLWRDAYFTNAEYVLICENTPGNIHCVLRKVVGFLLFHKILGYIALAFALIFGLLRKDIFGYLTLASSMIAILFFNASLGVITFVFALMLFIYKKRNPQR
ncbi:MAG: hypothetical protein PHU40_04505 [Sulfurimonas sp.]|nr:hypothetical protein [Sulfurimonas sp.]